jgi:hypothetical protein
MYKINIKDEDIDFILKKYKKYLDKDLLQLLRKLKDKKPDFITDEERELILDNYSFYEGINDSLGDLFNLIEEEEEKN